MTSAPACGHKKGPREYRSRQRKFGSFSQIAPAICVLEVMP